jgi:1,4-dihydroxy-2-naphthoate octaprenyltransferase
MTPRSMEHIGHAESDPRWKILSAWFHAARPGTLPLALSGTALGSLLAAADHEFSWSVCVLALLTTLLLQILSNLANDYGDFVNGKDTAGRIGPPRMLQTGRIAPAQMVKALVALVITTLAAGTVLVAAGTSGTGEGVWYILLGCAAIVAAVTYTVGKHPYGYQGWGDLSVFVFFGMVGTLGTYYLHAHHLRWDVVLPAASIGLLSTGVLNLNNLRDEQSDGEANKRTLVIILGYRRARVYHVMLLVTAVLTGLTYVVMNYRSPLQLLFLSLVPLLYQDIMAVFGNTRRVELNAELKKLSLSTLLFALTLGAGMLIH